ncbi:MAG: T9SS type A sorting domain-containing protein [Ignavibacteriae bacterium]|nr:T9SS type A sorting domain-containing protein [Ignavibacteriota bacterium]
MFHGTSDVVVPYGTGYAYSCTNYVRTEGSDELRKRFRNLSKPFELDYVPGGGHEGYYPIEYIQSRSIKFLKRVLCNQPRQIIIENYTTLLDTLLSTVTNANNSGEKTADKFELFQNYPNPFNPTTNIKYQISSTGFVSLKIYDLLGKEVVTLVNEKQESGEYEVIFNGSGLSSGVYFYRLSSGDFSDVRKMILMK